MGTHGGRRVGTPGGGRGEAAACAPLRGASGETCPAGPVAWTPGLRRARARLSVLESPRSAAP